MKGKLALTLFPLMLVGTLLQAESLCVKCLEAAQTELKKCLEGAISKEDKISCAQKQEARSKTCEDGECKIERVQKSKDEVSPEKNESSER